MGWQQCHFVIYYELAFVVNFNMGLVLCVLALLLSMFCSLWWVFWIWLRIVPLMQCSFDHMLRGGTHCVAVINVDAQLDAHSIVGKRTRAGRYV